MNARRHGILAAAITLVVVLLAGLAFAAGAAADETPTPGPTTTPTATTTTEPPTSALTTLDDAVLTWELNDESNNKAFAPGTYNFLSAGAVPDPGRGGQNIVAPGVWRGTSTRAWRARAGEVFVQKQRADGAWSAASFAGLSTARDGSTLSGTAGPFSGHRVVLAGGTGTLDAAAGTATIRWKGSFSVVYYSGFTFFTVTDPVLAVADGRGRLTATLAGFASDRSDPEKWAPVPAQRGVVLADLPDVDLGATGARGLTAQPAYRGIECRGSAQVREGDWGSFPASYLTYMDRVGSSAFWYSSGGAADAHKVPKPLSVTYDVGRPTTPEPTDEPTGEPTDEPTSSPTATPTTTVNPTPPPVVLPTTTPPPAVTQPPGPSLPPVAAGVPTATASTPVPAVQPPTAPPTVYALAAGDTATVTAPEPEGGAAWPWWLGTLLLVGAAALTVVTARPPKGTR